MEKPTNRLETAAADVTDLLPDSDGEPREACPPAPVDQASAPGTGAAPEEVVAVPGQDGSWSARPLICNQRGLHARAAAKFVKLTAQFDAAVTVSKGGQSVSGQSIMGLMMLAAAPGCRIQVHATGSEAEAAIRAICTLVAERFHEE